MYGASSSIVVSMLTPFARRVISPDSPLKTGQGLRRDCALDLWSVCKAESEELPLLRSRHRTLCLVHFELELLRDESRDALHHPLTCPLASYVDVAIIGVTNVAVSASR